MAIASASALDYPGFAALRRAARDQGEQGALAAARQFEALVLQMMVKSMRQATPGDPFLSGSSSKVYRDLFDQQLATQLSESRTFGLADMLVGQLRRSGALRRGASEAPVALDPTPPRRGLLPAVSGRKAEGQPVEDSSTEAPFELQAKAPHAGNGFGERDAFVRAVRPHAVRAARALGVDPGILIAQAALESGWGRSTLRTEEGGNGFNLFGIKASPSWRGGHVTVPTLEYEGGVAVRRQAVFRAYSSYAESFDDYVALVSGSPRYAAALEQASDPRAYMRELQAAGYATDPRYADKVIQIWERELGGLTVARR